VTPPVPPWSQWSRPRATLGVAGSVCGVPSAGNSFEAAPTCLGGASVLTSCAVAVTQRTNTHLSATVVAVVATESNPGRCWVDEWRAECRHLDRGRSHLFWGRQCAHELRRACFVLIVL